MRVAVLGGGPISLQVMQALIASDLHMGIVCLERPSLDIEALGLCPTENHFVDFGIELIRHSIPQWEPENSYCPVEFLQGFNTAPLYNSIENRCVQPFFKEHYEDERSYVKAQITIRLTGQSR